MAIIKKYAPLQNLSNYNTFLTDTNSNSTYFRISEFGETFTGGKNGFLIEGSECLKETTEIKIEILDVVGNTIYYEPGDGIPEYYEGTSKLISVHIYDDTPIGIAKITILGELKSYFDVDGNKIDVPDDWKGVYNVKWEKEFKVNKSLSNESVVRFYKRPTVSISELVKPILTKTINNATDTGNVNGFPLQPSEGQKLSDWRAGTNYLLQRTSGTWDIDVDESQISISSLSYNPTIIEVLNDTDVIVDIPYTDSSGNVAAFSNQAFSVTYQDIENETVGETSITGSFAKIDVSQLKTFVGDVARVKIFRKSRNAVGDFQFVQEAKLESQELLRDVTAAGSTEVFYGKLTDNTFSTYWETSSVDHPVTIESANLSRAAHIDYDTTAGGVQQLITSESISISNDVEYTLQFKTLLSGSLSDTNKSVRAFFSSSDFTQDFLTISGSAIYRAKQNISKNIISQNTGDAKLVFEVKGDDWFISNISLRNAQDTSFSPDEFTIIQDIPRKTATETFDFIFEFYDINNNFIPVNVTATKEFDGGNDFPTSGKLFTFESDRNAFRFSSGSVQNPTGQQIQFKTSKQNLTGSVTFASSAFDVDGNYLNPSDYSVYPGKLTSVTTAGAIITINNFTGSRTDNSETPFVGSIIYTASLDGLEEFETVYRLEDGDNAPQLIVTSNANQFIYEPTTLSPKPSGQTITVRAQRKNLASLVTPIEVNSGSNRPELTYIDTVGGIDTYTISATAFSQSFTSNNFDEVTYSFTGSDVFGNSQTDEITLSKVINFDAVSLVLSNESTSFPAKSTGVVTGGFVASSGSVQMFIGGTQITHDDYDSDSARNRNTFDIKTITESNVTASSTSPTNEFYSITGFDTNKDSGSLILDIEYLAGDNITSQSFEKIVSYTKSKKAVPNVLTKTSPSTQTINSGSSGFEVPQTIEVVVQEGGTEYSYQDGLSGGDSETYKFQINGVLSGSNSNEIITPDYATSYATQASYTGTIGSASISYVDSEGTFVENKNVRFDISVSKTGVDGDPAKAVKLKTDRFIILYDDYGNVTGSNTIGLTGSAQGYGTPEFQFLQNDTEIQGFSTDNTIEIPTDGGSLPAVDGTAFFEVRTREQGQSYTNVDDELEVYGVGKGRNYLVFFTNETHNFPADEFGNLKDGALENGSTEVRFYKNIDGILREFTYDQNSPYGNNTFRTGSGDGPSDFDNITVSGSILPSGRLKYTPTAVTGPQGGFEIGFIDNSDTSNTALDRQYTFSIGEDGIKFKDLEIDISDGGNFIKPDSGSIWSPSVLQIDGIKTNITGSVNWTAGFDLYDSATGGSTTTTGNTVYARYDDFVSSFNSGTVKFPITASLTNSEDSVVYTDSDSIKVLQDGSSAITVDVSNPLEDVIATNGGFVDDYTDTGTDIQVFQGADLLTFTTGTAGDGQYTISTSISPANSIQLGTISGNGTTTFTISDHDDMDQDEDKVTITYTASGKRFDGTSFSRTGQQKIVKVKDAKPPLSPTSLRVSDSLDSTPFDGSPGTTGTPTISNTHYGLWNSSATAITTNTGFDNIHYLGLGASLTSDNNFSTDMKVYCQRTLEVGDVVVLYQDADNYGNYTVHTKTNADGSGDTVLRLTPISHAGTLTVQSLDYIGFGRELVGPGVVYRGEYDSGTTYYYTETRRDVVQYSGTYYLASNPSDSGTSNWGTPGSSTDWEEFGAEFSSVATDILFAQDVYANRTVNIGSNAGNPVIALNSDHSNSNANPSIAIGAASYEGAGIFLGYDSGTAKASLVNSGGTRHLKWDGSNLDIKGSITITGGPAQSSLNAINSTTESLQTDVNNAQSGVDAINSTSSSLENPTSYNFGPNGGPGFDLIDVTPGSTAGLYLGASNLGYHDGSDWNAYLDSSGNFYLGGTSGALTWDGSNLNIAGSITITGGPAASSLSSLNDATQSLDNSVGLLNTATESLQTDVNNAQGGVDAINATTGGLENPTSYDFGPSATFALDDVPDAPTNTAGLYLGQQYLGYHDGTDWKTFISSSGDAFFEGTVSGSSILGGNISIGGGNFAVNNEGRLTATDAIISGEISSSEATLGAWLVNEDAITATTGTIVLNATDEYIHLKDSSLVTKVNLNTDNALTTPSAGNSNNGSENASTRTGGTTSNNVFWNPSVTREEITSFTAGTGGNHQFTYQYTNGNQSYISATGTGTYISGRVTLKVWTGDYGTTLVASTTIESKFAQGDTYDQPPSVIGNTKIILSNGLVKLAKDITKEDELLTWDYKTKTFATAKPSTIKTRTVYKTYKVYVEGKEVEVSENHGFWLDNNHEIKVKKLKAGKDKIYIKDGNEVKLSLVKKVEKINKQEKVFTFRIPEYENYISNEILSHNPGYDETDTQYFTDNKSATVSWNATNAVEYYFTLEYNVNGNLVTAMGASNPELLYQFNYDGNWSWASLNSGTEINNAGLQVSNDGDRVFRAQTSATAGDPWITMIGGMEVDYFVPRYSHQTAGTYSYGSTGNLDINYSKKAYPLTRAMWRIVLGDSSEYSGTFSTLTLDDPHINIVAAVRYSNSNSAGGNWGRNQYFRVQLDEAMATNEACPFVSSYGRAGDTPSFTNFDAEFTSDIGVKYGSSGYVYYQFEDNDTNGGGRDAYTHYGVVFG